MAKAFAVHVAMAAGACLLPSSSLADGFYLSGRLGTASQQSSDNTGRLTANFTTGVVGAIPQPLDIPAGAEIGWHTGFKSDVSLSGAFGYDYGKLRLELAITSNASNVKGHTDANLAGVDLNTIDAGVLVTGNEGDLGVSTAVLLSNGSGEIATTSVMLNGFYDFALPGSITPYLGAGIGSAGTEVTFAPSNTSIVDDEDRGFAWQAIAGAQYAITDQLSFAVSYRHVSIEDVSVAAELVPATLDINNDFQILEVGLRFMF